MANEAHKIKLLVLWDILCKNTDENHALNTDEISELLALRGLNVSRKILVQDIATLCDNGYEVLSYKKKYHYYYVVNRSLETAEVVMLADVINASKLPVAQKKALAQRLAETLCTHQAESISKHIIKNYKNDGIKTQRVKIVYNCVGTVSVPNIDNEPVKTDKTKIIEVA